MRSSTNKESKSQHGYSNNGQKSGCECNRNSSDESEKTLAHQKENIKKKFKLNDKQYHEFVNHIFDNISKSLKQGQSVKIRGFGTFKISKYQARNGRNPKTGENIHIPAKKVVKLNIARDLKNKLQKLKS